MPAREERDQKAFDDDILADDDRGNAFAQLLNEFNDGIGLMIGRLDGSCIHGTSGCE
jgi:hypothetical protein